MSSSSSEEDEELKRAAMEAVDTTFLDSYRAATTNTLQNDTEATRGSQRHLTAVSHYNDVRVPPELQRRVARQLSAVIDASVEFVTSPHDKIKKPKIRGGVKLFSSSTSYLTTQVAPDTATEQHNIEASKRKKQKRRIVREEGDVEERDKFKMSAVSSEHIFSGDETKHWKSRRKEKLFKYKQQGNSKVLVSIDDK